MILALVLILASGSYQAEGSCPTLCDQKSCSLGLLLCSQPGLGSIPEVPSHGITIVIIMNQAFQRSVLNYRNLSRYGPEEINLKQLTLQNCGLTDIESESFSHLIHLNELDLSLNDLRIIRPQSFKALNLKVLKLDGNRSLKLTKDSLKGLVVNALSLSGCGLSDLHFDSIREISGHLTKLILSNNNLKTLSNRFFLLFRRLEVLRLDKNQLKCDCHLRWLLGILVKVPESKESEYISATCFAPLELRGQSISSLSETAFECLIPTLSKVSVNILSARSAELTCSAATQSDARIYWLHRNVVNASQTPVKFPNDASIHIRGTTTSDKYSCFVVNDNGNVTVDLNIHWSPDSVTSVPKTSSPLNKFFSVSPEYTNKNLRYLFLRQFSLLEMMLSISTTFVITIVLFSLIYFVLARRLRFVKDNISLNRSGYDVGLYSDIPVYDVPQMYPKDEQDPSSPLSIHSGPLIDFKTQRLIPSHHC